MNEETKIRELKKEDYLDVFELEKQVYKIHYINRPDLYNDISSLFPRNFYELIIDNQNCISLGIEETGRIVAIILAEIKETNNISIVKNRKYCFIDDIVVDEKYRRKGYAKRLFEILKDRLKELNINDIELTVWPFNKSAIAFYESLGMSVKNIKYELKTNEKINTELLELNSSQSTK